MVAVKTFETLREIIYELGIPDELICLNASIYQDLQLDSTEIVEIALVLKRRLGIKIKLETRQDKTLAEICSLIESAKSEQLEKNF